MVKFVIFLVIMKNDKPVVGVIGVGHLGQHHVKHYQLLEDANLAGLYDNPYMYAYPPEYYYDNEYDEDNYDDDEDE